MKQNNQRLQALLEQIDTDIVLNKDPDVSVGQFSEQEKKMIHVAADHFVRSIQGSAHKIAERIEQKYPHLKPTDPGDPSPVIIELMKVVLEQLSSAGKPPPFEF